jgi:hypothetical protein
MRNNLTTFSAQVWLALLGLFFSFNVHADVGGNRVPSSPSVTGVSIGNGFLYWIRFTAPVSGTVDSLGGWFRDNDDGSGTVILMLHDTTGASGTAPGSFVDSTDQFPIDVGAGFGSFAEITKPAKIRTTITAGLQYMLGVYGVASTGSDYVARENSFPNNFLTDSTWILNVTDPLPIANPIGASTKTVSAAYCLFVVITPSGGGGGGGSGQRVLIRKN